MIRRLGAAGMVAALWLSILFGANAPVQAMEPDAATDSKDRASLSEQQQQVIEDLSRDILAKRKEMLMRYVEYGVLDEERAAKIARHMDKHYDKLRQNGYIPHEWHGSKRAERTER